MDMDQIRIRPGCIFFYFLFFLNFVLFWRLVNFLVLVPFKANFQDNHFNSQFILSVPKINQSFLPHRIISLSLSLSLSLSSNSHVYKYLCPLYRKYPYNLAMLWSLILKITSDLGISSELDHFKYHRYLNKGY